MLTLGSLFDGVGTWQLSATKAGIEPVYCSEIDDFPATVSAHHFPKTKQLGDITKIDVNELEPVDIICAGSPCQDLSVAGKREGLSGERSGLFRTAIELVHGLRKRTGKPRYFVWENVPGAFSSNKGNDFRAVLEEITKTEIPMPKDNKWAESGMVEWDGGSLAWRTLDAQGWGVPQRRRRIFLVADFDGRSAAEILFVEQGLHGDSAESKGKREETAADVGASTDSAIGVDIYNNKITGDKVTALTTNNTSTSTAPKVMTSINSASETLTPWDVQSNRIQSIDGKAATLYGGAGQGTHNGAIFDTRQIDTASGFKYRQGAKAGGIGWQNGKAPTLELSQNCAVYDISHRQDVIRPQENGTLPCLTARAGTGGNNLPIVHCLNDQGGKVMDVSEEKAGTLRAEAHGHAPIVHTVAIEGNGSRPSHKGNGYKETDKMYTLNTTEVHKVAAFPQQAYDKFVEGKPLSTLKAQGGSYGGESETLISINKTVRRLTPLECERLMGLPDLWTDVEFNGKPAPDSKRYKAIGNGMAVPCSDFIMKRIAEVSNGQNQRHD